MQGNPIEGPSLTIVDFPKYNWYPRYFQVQVVMLGTGEQRSITIKLVDCLNDDPTCEEYNALDANISPEQIAFDDPSDTTDKSNALTLKVFDIMGRILYSGPFTNFNNDMIPLGLNGMDVLLYFDQKGTLIKSEKRILIK